MKYRSLLEKYRSIVSAIERKYIRSSLDWPMTEEEFTVRYILTALDSAIKLIEVWFKLNPGTEEDTPSKRQRLSDLLDSNAFTETTELDQGKVNYLIDEAKTLVKEISEKIAEDICLSMNSLWNALQNPRKFIAVLRASYENSRELLDDFPFLEYIYFDSVITEVVQTFKIQILEEKGIKLHRFKDNHGSYLADRSIDSTISLINFIRGTETSLSLWDLSNWDLTNLNIKIWLKLANVFLEKNIFEVFINKRSLEYFSEKYPSVFAAALVMSGVISLNTFDDLFVESDECKYLMQINHRLRVFNEFFSQEAIEKYGLRQLQVLIEYLCSVCPPELNSEIKSKRELLRKFIGQVPYTIFNVTKLRMIRNLSYMEIAYFTKKMNRQLDHLLLQAAKKHIENLFLNPEKINSNLIKIILKTFYRVSLAEHELNIIDEKFSAICHYLGFEAIKELHEYLKLSVEKSSDASLREESISLFNRISALIEGMFAQNNKVICIYTDLNDFNFDEIFLAIAFLYFYNYDMLRIEFPQNNHLLTSIPLLKQALDVLQIQQGELKVILSEKEEAANAVNSNVMALPITRFYIDVLLYDFPAWMKNKTFTEMFSNVRHLELHINSVLLCCEKKNSLILSESLVSLFKLLPANITSLTFSGVWHVVGQDFLNQINSILKKTDITELIFSDGCLPVIPLRNLELDTLIFKMSYLQEFVGEKFLQNVKALQDFADKLSSISKLDRLTIDIRWLSCAYKELTRLVIDSKMYSAISSELPSIQNGFIKILENTPLQKCNFYVDDAEAFLILLRNILPKLTRGKVFINYEFSNDVVCTSQEEMQIKELLMPFRDAWQARSGQGVRSLNGRLFDQNSQATSLAAVKDSSYVNGHFTNIGLSFSHS